MDENGKRILGDDGKPIVLQLHVKATVSAYIKLKTPYASLDVFRIEFRSIMDGNQKHSTSDMLCKDVSSGEHFPCHGLEETTKLWYAPELSMVVKSERTIGNHHVSRSYELVSVQ
jgi:hypothetical protein